MQGGCQCIWLILGDFARCWMVLGNFGIFYDLLYLYDLFFLTIFVPFKGIQFQVIFLIIDFYKVFVLFPLHIRSKYQEYASYVNTDKRNTIHISIQTQRIKKEMCLEVPKIAKGKLKICLKKVQKTHCCLKLTK